jgi:hypothetical protein
MWLALVKRQDVLVQRQQEVRFAYVFMNTTDTQPRLGRE